MAEADDASTPRFPRPERVPDCVARLETLYQLADEQAADPDEDEAVTRAWCTAERIAVAALAAAPARGPAELAAKCEWVRRLVAEYEPLGCSGDVLHELVGAVARDARALADAAKGAA